MRVELPNPALLEKPPKVVLFPPNPEVLPPKADVFPANAEVLPPKPEVLPPKPVVLPPKPVVLPPKPEVLPPKPDVLPKFEVLAAPNAPKLWLPEKLPKAPAGVAVVFNPRVGGPSPPVCWFLLGRTALA